MALSLRNHINVAAVLADRINASIYAYAKTGDTTFAECQRLASPALREAYRIVKEHLVEMKEAAVETGLASRIPDEAINAFAVLKWVEDENGG